MKKLTLSCFILSLGLLSPSVWADQQTAMSSGCLGCHKADGKLIGPSFQEIAAKYAAQDGVVDELAATVKAGSQGGKWGNVPMPPSPADIENIKTVISWMLTHK